MAMSKNKGKYFPQNPQKYRGKVDGIIFRSMLEFKTFLWADRNSAVEYWSSEEVVVPYICKTDGKKHRYFIDLVVKFKSGKLFWIEIKPEKETLPPVRKNQRQKTYLQEVLTFSKNASKWEYAEVEAKRHGAIFQIWTEKTLKKLGIHYS